jgi:hypothetical protein
MEAQTIRKDVAINAPKEKVWTVLFRDEYTRQWYAAFSEGAYAQTDWQQGSKAVFTDSSNCGLIGTVVVNRPLEELSVEYTGVLVNGQEDYESNDARAVKGGRETYRLSSENGHTFLAIACDMGPDFFAPMAAAWDVALDKIKGLAESA